METKSPSVWLEKATFHCQQLKTRLDQLTAESGWELFANKVGQHNPVGRGAWKLCKLPNLAPALECGDLGGPRNPILRVRPRWEPHSKTVVGETEAKQERGPVGFP